MFTATKILIAILGVGSVVLFIYLVRRAAYRQLESGVGKRGDAR